MRISGCRLREKTQDRLAEFFVGGVTARSAADLARVNRKTAAYFFHRLRQIIASHLEDSRPVEGLVEVDESYFGGVRKGKRGRWPSVTALIQRPSPSRSRGVSCRSSDRAEGARSTVLTMEEEAVVAFRNHSLLPLADCPYAPAAKPPAPDALVSASLSAAPLDLSAAED